MELGGSVALAVSLQGSISGASEGDDIAVRPDAALYKVTAETPAAEEVPAKPVALNARTRVDQYGVLHVQKSGLRKGDVITVAATSTYTNPSGVTQPFTGTATVTVK